MEKLDTEKLKEVLEMMVESGAVFLKYEDLIIEFPRNDTGKGSTEAVGFQATNSDDADVTEQKKQLIGQTRPVGYSALFGDKRPAFAKPIAEGKHV